MGITVLQLHKRASYEFKHIQDKYDLNIDNNIFALADGTTQSFNSEIWAQIITKKFVDNPTFNPIELIGLFTKHVADFKSSKFEFSPNPAKASLEKAKQSKGGTSTFIGVQLIKQNKIEIISCGDTNLFLMDLENRVSTFPFTNVESLDANNHFVNTEELIQNNIDETFFKQKCIEYKPKDRIIIATDALSRLILKKPSVLSVILKIENFNQLKEFCTKYWEGKELQEDDISAIIINFQSSNEVNLIHPPNDFSFPKEKEEEFIPTSLKFENKTKYTDMQMSEIKNQFNGVANDFYQVKKKLNLHEILLMVTISLLMIIILLMYFLRPINSKVVTSNSIGKSENVMIEKYEKKIKSLHAEIHTLKSKITDLSQSKEVETNENEVEPTSTSPTISIEEAKRRQKN